MADAAAVTPAVPESDESAVASPEVSVEELLVEEDLVVEEVSIDGMCGVY